MISGTNLNNLLAGGDDYQPIFSQSLPVSAGSNSACLTVTVVNDDDPELALEFFNLVLSSSDSNVIISNSIAVVAIQNEDREYLLFNMLESRAVALLITAAIFITCSSGWMGCASVYM